MLGREFHEVGWGLHAVQLLDKVKCGVGIGVSEFHELIVVVSCTFQRGGTTGFHEIGRFGRSRAHSLVSLFGLCSAFCAISLNACGSLVFWNPAGFAVVVLF